MCLPSYNPPPVTPLPPPPANAAQPQLAPVVANGGEDINKKVQDLTSNIVPLVIPYKQDAINSGNIVGLSRQPGFHAVNVNPGEAVPNGAVRLPLGNASQYYSPNTLNQGQVNGEGYRFNPATNTVLTIQPAANRLSPSTTNRSG